MIKPRYILTLNHRFVPPSAEASYGFGVVGFVIELARALAAQDQLAGFITYQREPMLEHPGVKPGTFLGYPSVQLRFNFDIGQHELRGVCARAVALLTIRQVEERGRDGGPLILYHQTNTLLPMTPPHLPFLVTHHGPFAAEIRRLFGRTVACEAFQGGLPKLHHLIAAQARGVDHLRASRNGAAVELSTVQEAVLHSQGVPGTKVWRIPPPVSVPTESRTATLNGRQFPAGEDAADELHLVTATARIDAFKDIGRLIVAANQLCAARVRVRLSLFVGDRGESRERAALSALVSEPLRARCRIAERLPHADRIRFFYQQRGRAIFVCTSLYETFGFTPMEAALAGMTTLVPNRPQHIGIADYLGKISRFDPTEPALVHRLLQCHARLERIWLGNEQRSALLSRVGPDRCVQALTAATMHLVNPSPNKVPLDVVDC